MGRRDTSHTALADEILAFYSQGHTVRETAERFGVNKNRVNYLAKMRHVSNGRTFEQGGRESNRLRSEGLLPALCKPSEEAGERLKEKLEGCGFDLLSEYKGTKKRIKIRCKVCGEIYERIARNCMRIGAACHNCKTIKSAEALRKREQERKAQTEKKKAEKLAANPLGLSAYQLEREKVLDVPHVCKVCGKEYTIRSYMQSIGTSYKRDSGYCSKACREKQKHINERVNRKKARAEGRRYCCNHYTRANRLGLPAEEGITKAKLLKRDGPFCALCFLPLQTDGDPKSDLYWSIDHIVPMHKGGGHTWDNVQLAHRLCNSNKRDLIGKRWNNGND